MKAQQNDVRPWHYITRNTRTCTPTSLLFVDTETTGIPIDGNQNATLQVLKLWCAVSVRLEKSKVRKRRVHAGTTCDEFWQLVDSLLSERRPLWLFAHNLGFDLTVLRFWDKLDSGQYGFGKYHGATGKPGLPFCNPHRRGFAVLDDPPVIIECMRHETKHTLTCVDTYNYFRSSVAALGESIGMTKLDMPADDAPRSTWDRYCMRDVEIIEQAIIGLMQFVSNNDLGIWRYTAPAQAFSAYRHRFMREKILVHGNADALKLEREAYYGGRLQCMYVGEVVGVDGAERSYWSEKDDSYHTSRVGPIYVLDIQSCYPAMMLWKQYPRALKDYVVMPSHWEMVGLRDDMCSIARATINSPTEPFPCRHNGRTVQAVGRYITTLCGPELQYAVYNGLVENIGALAIYEPADLFSEYVSTMWNMRCQAKADGNKCMEQWCKLMLNSLAGKFGQRARKWEPREDLLAPMPWGHFARINTATNESNYYRSLAWAVQEEQEAGESIDSCPAIAAYITSYAREYLRELIHIAGDGHVYYVDTDCIHCDLAGYNNITVAGKIGTGEIGSLRLVGRYDSAEYRGLKDYTLDGVSTIAGIKAKAEVIADRQYRQDEFQKLHSILSGSPAPGVQVKRVTIDRRNTFPPGRIQPDGTVLPVLV